MLHEHVLGTYDGLDPWTQRIVLVIAVLLLSMLAAWIARAILHRVISRGHHLDPTLARFLKTLVTTLAVLFVVFTGLLAAGLPPTALAGVVAAAGLAMGFALKDTLGNLAAGVQLLINRPYNIGETVSIHGHDGTVTELGIAMTRLNTFDGRFVTVPNGAVITEAILNWSRNPTRRVAVDVDVSYGDDLQGAVRTALETAQGHPSALSEPPPQVLVSNLASDGVTLTVWAWVNTPDFLATWSELRGQLKLALEENGYTIPFPQRDVYMKTAE